jgi:hypothetical protein
LQLAQLCLAVKPLTRLLQNPRHWEKTGKVPKWADKLVRLVRQKTVVQASNQGWTPDIQPADDCEEVTA